MRGTVHDCHYGCRFHMRERVAATTHNNRGVRRQAWRFWCAVTGETVLQVREACTVRVDDDRVVALDRGRAGVESER